MKYTPGLMVGQLSGKAGSTVASHNRNGSYFRSRTIPANPNTSAQATQRNNVQELSQTWRTLTDEQRTAWAGLGAQMTRLDRQGNAYTLTGNQAFMSVNRNLRLLGLADVSDAPLFTGDLNVTSVSFASLDSSDTISVAFTPTPIGADNYLVIECSAPVSAGINFVPRSGFRKIFQTALNGTSPSNIATAYNAKFGSLVGLDGAKVFVRARIINASGVAGVPITASAIVQAGA